jgi:hypothetical protein
MIALAYISSSGEYSIDNPGVERISSIDSFMKTLSSADFVEARHS